MADPDHVPDMDTFDRLTVVMYRLGLVTSAVGLALLASRGVTAGASLASWIPHGVILAGTALAVAHLHLYDKRIRWMIGLSAWTGAAFCFVGASTAGTAAHWLGHAGLGFLFVSLSGLALKERLCFRIPGLRLVPVLLAASLVPLLAGWATAGALLLGAAAGIYAVLAWSKLRMPLHFDVGNKASYQV